MTRDELGSVLKRARIVPVLTIKRADDAVPLARALVAGGIRMLEVTLRTEAAAEAARRIVAEVPDAIVGVGTILDRHDLMQAVLLGARFGVSPGTTPQLLEALASSDVPFLPGIATASELIPVQATGFGVAKFFPAEQAGGIAMLRALAGPFPAMRFCPTGGIGEANAKQWLAEPNVIAVGGSWLTPSADIDAGNWDAITARCKRTMAALA